MVRGCLLSLLMLAAFIAGYMYWLDQTLDRPASLWAGGIAGFFVLCCVGALGNAWRAWGDARRVAAAQHHLRLDEGRLATVCGTIHPAGEPLLAPFSNRECILCEYDFVSPQTLDSAKDSDNTGSDYAGFLMNPAVIRTPHGEVKLLGFPILEGFQEQRFFSYTAAGQALIFLKTSEFEDRTGLKMVSVLSMFDEIFADDDGLVRKNIKIGKVAVEDIFTPALLKDIEESERLGLENESAPDIDDDEDDLDDDNSFTSRLPKMMEKRVEIGEDVCAIGVYDDVRRGLVPLSKGGKPNRLLKGSAEIIIQKSRSSMFANFFGAIFFLAVIHGALFALTHLYVRSPEVVRDRRYKAEQAIQHGEAATLEKILRKGFDANHTNDNGESLLHLSPNGEITAVLLLHGANVHALDAQGDTPLIEAARHGRSEIVRQLLAAGADPTVRSQNTGRTALEEATERGHEEAAALLRK